MSVMGCEQRCVVAIDIVLLFISHLISSFGLYSFSRHDDRVDSWDIRSQMNSNIYFHIVLYQTHRFILDETHTHTGYHRSFSFYILLFSSDCRSWRENNYALNMKQGIRYLIFKTSTEHCNTYSNEILFTMNSYMFSYLLHLGIFQRGNRSVKKCSDLFELLVYDQWSLFRFYYDRRIRDKTGQKPQQIVINL